MLTEARNSFGVRLALILILIIGMLEVYPTQPVLAATLIVTNTNDSGVGSLRQAILNATSGDMITFDPSLAGQTIILATDLLINKNLSIDGLGLSPQITVSGGNVAHLVIQNSTLPPTVTISDLTIIHGYTTNNGGAISVGGNLTLINSTLRNNYAVGSGGAISGSNLTLKNTTLTQNQAGANGGAILISGNSMSTIINSTITQNQAVTGGGMTIMGNPIVDVFNSTFAHSVASSGSELALIGNGALQLSNTIFVCKPGNNGCIIQNGNFSVPSMNSIIGTGALYDFGLAELADNGGPTQTMALFPWSSLIDAGDDSICSNSQVNNLDQRGVSRLQGSHCDIGAYELSYLTVSGNAGTAGAIMKYEYSLFTVADNNGNYSIKVLPGWSGTVVPSKQGHSFTPVKKVYTNVQSNKTGQNYSATASTYIYPGNLGDTWRVSVPNGGGQSDGDTYDPSISADGRYVAYWSFASNLVAGDGANDIIVYDNQTGQTSAVSVDSNGTPLDCNSYAPSISADGRYVSFSSCAWNQPFTVYVYDRHTGILDSVARGDVSSISADGRYVAYHSIDNPNFQFRVFVEDLLNRTGIQISISTTGGQPDGDSFLPSISANGRYIAFCSSATNLIDSDTNGVEDIFVSDIQTGETTRVSVASSDVQANGASFTPSISADGRYVTFHSAASNLVSNDTNGVEDVFVHDLQTGVTTRVSINSNGAQANQASNQAHIFANGRYVAFRSFATNLVSGDTNGVADIFIYDRQMGTTRRISVSSNSMQGNGDSPSSYSSGFSISEDGKYLAFSSDATNLVNGDTNGNSDIFVHETTCSCTEITIGEDLKGSFDVPLHESWRQSFSGVNNGPVKITNTNVTSIIGSERVIYKVNNANTSFSELMALPNGQLDNTYWLPWYNNVDLDIQLRIANVSGSPATVNVYIGGSLMTTTPITLQPGESTRKSFAANNGPVQILSDQNIVAAERVIYKVNNINTSFSELMALPNGQLSKTYWLPWYNNVDLDTQLRFANVSGSTATVHVLIGGVEMTGSPFALAPGESTRQSFAVNNGPVKIESDQNIVAAERVIYKVNNIPTSFSEMMALPNGQLDTTYWLPWYNNVDLDTQLRFGNVSGSTATVHVFIGGVEMTGSPFILSAGQSTRQSFAVNNGPVKIESDQNIVAAERVIYKVNNTNTSFSEMMALPNSQLDTTYWLPWYNNIDLDTQLRFGVP